MDDHDDQEVHENVMCDGISSPVVDAAPVRQIIPEDLETAEPVLPPLRGNLNSEDYPMDYESKGKCFIFNHKYFKKLETRYGTDYDASCLKSQFRKLGFEVETFEDLTVLQVIDKLDEVADDENHWNRSCFVCCILTHADNGMLCAHDGIYSVDKVFAPFKGDKCPSLRGKPKLFFIQAHEIAASDPGGEVTFFDCGEEEETLKIPAASDFLVAYSTSPGYSSFEDDNCGSWFIQSLCNVLKMYANSMDLLQMLTVVNRKVALVCESCSPDDEPQKQAPYFNSTLMRSVKFCEF